MSKIEVIDRTDLAQKLAAIPWRERVDILKEIIQRVHKPQELPPGIRAWLEADRTKPIDDVVLVQRPEEEGWFKDKQELVPVLGWVLTGAHFLKDGIRWWLLAAQRHDDSAPLVGPTVPAPASRTDLNRLAKIIEYASGRPRKVLLCTGAITQEEHDEYIENGRPDLAEYGTLFYWWRA